MQGVVDVDVLVVKLGGLERRVEFLLAEPVLANSEETLGTSASDCWAQPTRR